MTALYIVLVLVVLGVIYAVSLYNGLVRKRNIASEAESGIDVQLKRRHDLIPNLVETVKGYAGHEKSVLTDVTMLRAQSMQATGMKEKAGLEAALTRSIGNLFAVAENYPDLKANQNFQQLQTDLTAIENEIQLARRFYNGAVRDYNTAIQSFPAMLVAGSLGFAPREFFELEDKGDRQTPTVNFS
ncbi:LemA family protein [Desulfovibrio inopinatus]|uniref:LemA family protein n=1 Tax=Desulfovibrio inopinatus TaxID=102109 RepID=UPI0004055ECB|nr:LemA family protein [Desulfovibrio inopinatus]